MLDVLKYKGTLLKEVSSQLKNGVNKESLYKELFNFLVTNDLDSTFEDELCTVLDILSGYHNPFVIADINGITINKPILKDS